MIILNEQEISLNIIELMFYIIIFFPNLLAFNMTNSLNGGEMLNNSTGW